MIGWLAWNMVGASAAMLLVLALRRPAARLFGAGIAYALWLLVPLRLLAPPLPEAAAMPGWSPPLDLVVAVERAAAPIPAAAGADWLLWLIALWAAGAAGFLAWQWLAYRAFLARLSLDARGLGGHAGVPLVESRAVEGPLALGLLDRRIVVPADFAARYAPEERRLALAHEAVHHRRGDIWWNFAALLILALNWFNPIAWLGFRAFREDQEIACDAAVAARSGTAAREAYGRVLVKSASRPGLIAACPLNHADQLKRRLKMMNRHRPTGPRTFAGAAAVASLAGAAIALGSPSLAHPHPEGAEGDGPRHRIVILEKGEGAAAGDRTHFLRIRRGENGGIELPEQCEGREIANVDERSGEERTRVLLCSRGEADAATQLQQLQTARERIAGNDEFPAEHRDRVLAALDREIARLRAAR